MDKPSQQTTVIGGILATIGLLVLSSQFSNFAIVTWSLFLFSAGAITIVLYLRDRSHRWLLLTSYVLWVMAFTLYLAYAVVKPEAWIIRILPAGFGAEGLIVPFILTSIAVPFWVSYFKNEKRAFLITAYIFSAILLVIINVFYSSSEFLFALILYAIAIPMLFSYFREKNHSLLIPGYLLAVLATSYSIGTGLELLLNSSNILIYTLGGGIIFSGLGLFSLRSQTKKTNPYDKLQFPFIGGILIVLGGIMLFATQSEISVNTVFFILISIGTFTGAWYLFDRSRIWLGVTSYVLFVIIGLIYINVGAGSLNANPQRQYVAPFIFGSIGVPFLLAYFRNTNKQGALITGYVFSVLAGFLLLAFGNFFNGILIAPFISCSIGLPFIFAYVYTKTRWTLVPGYAILSVGVALLLGSLVRDATSFERAFQYTAASFLVLAGLGMRALRPMLK